MSFLLVLFVLPALFLATPVAGGCVAPPANTAPSAALADCTTITGNLHYDATYKGGDLNFRSLQELQGSLLLDSVPIFSFFSSLTTVTGDMTLSGRCGGTFVNDVASSLTTVGGTLSIIAPGTGNVPTIRSIVVPKLQEAGSIVIRNVRVASSDGIQFEVLQHITKGALHFENIREVSGTDFRFKLDRLIDVEGEIIFRNIQGLGRGSSSSQMPELFNLNRAGGFVLEHCDTISTLESLGDVVEWNGGIVIAYNDGLETINRFLSPRAASIPSIDIRANPRLQHITGGMAGGSRTLGSVSIQGNPQLDAANVVNALLRAPTKTVESLTLMDNGGSSMQLPAVTVGAVTVASHAHMRRLAVGNVGSLRVLGNPQLLSVEGVAGSVTIDGNPTLQCSLLSKPLLDATSDCLRELGMHQAGGGGGGGGTIECQCDCQGTGGGGAPAATCAESMSAATEFGLVLPGVLALVLVMCSAVWRRGQVSASSSSYQPLRGVQ